jgi:anti-anti-sigma factor
MLRIDIQRNSRTATLHCRGRIVFGMEIETLRSIVQSRTERVLEIDLGGIETIDASGLGLLVELQHWANVGNRILYFTNASEFVARLVAVTRLYNVLVIAPGRERVSRQPTAAALSA